MPPLIVPPWTHPLAAIARVHLDLAHASLEAVRSQLVTTARAADWQSTAAHAFHDRIAALRAGLDAHAERVREVSAALEVAMSAAVAAERGGMP